MNNDLLTAKEYMNDYKLLVEIYKQNIGIIGRLFAKIFGTTMYKDIEEELYNRYNITYLNAYTILYETHNLDYIYDPFFKNIN